MSGLRLPGKLCTQVLRLLRSVGIRVSSFRPRSANVLHTLLCRILVLLGHTCYASVPPRANGRPRGSVDDFRLDQFFRLIKRRFQRRRSMRFCTSGLYVAPGCLGRVLSSTVGVGTGRCVLGGIASRTRHLLACASLPVSRVTSRLRFSAISCFMHDFQRYVKCAPLTCQGVRGP